MNNKILIAMTGAAMALSVIGSGCGGGSSSGGTAVVTPTIVVHGGYRGYYSGSTFCFWGNNYCGTGNAYGIIVPTVILVGGYYGYYDGTIFCDYTNDYCSTGLYWGIGDDGTYCDFNYCGGTVTSSSGSTGSTGTGTGSTGTGTGSTGTGTGSTGTGTGSTGTTTGGSSGSGTGTGGSSGTGSTTGSSGSGTTTGGSSGSCTGSGCTTSAFGGSTKDVNLQATALKQSNIDSRAQSMMSQFPMSFDSAQKLVQLSDRMAALQNSGQLSDEARMQIADSALGVAGISHDEVVSAVSAKINNHDSSKLDAVIEKGAANLGMPDSSALRTQILPSLGLPIQ